jgi:RNA polymerase sigma factor (sigma-70 family)
MPRRHRDSLLAFVRKMRAAGDTSDRQLLQRFCGQREESAFAALVERHGSMVLSVCRRILGDAHEAEDAFQATFLVLARRAGSIGKPELLSNWLYGVAWRTASRARVAAAQRRAHEKQAAVSATVNGANALETSELRAVIDEELNRLPARHRAPIVLCYLEGKSQEEAAAQLGWTKGSLRGRLDRAREKLRKRLLRRGLAVTVGALSGALADDAVAATVPAALVQRTASAAMAFAAGVGAEGAISSGTMFLTRGVLRAMLMSKLRVGGMIVLTFCVIGSGLVRGRVAFGQRENAPAPELIAETGALDVQLAKFEPSLAPPPKPGERHVVDEVRDRLEEHVTLSFEQGTKLQDALEFISDKYNLTILIDEQAFKKAEASPDGREPVETAAVRLPKLADVKLRSVIRMVLDQAEADYVIQNDFIRVVPRAWMDSEMPLRQLIDSEFDHTRLRDALRALSRKTGTCIVLDERAEQGEQSVTMRLDRVPLVTAVSVLADTQGLKAVALRNMIYVTSKENGKAFEAQQAPALRKVDPYFNPPPPADEQKHSQEEKKRTKR